MVAKTKRIVESKSGKAKAKTKAKPKAKTKAKQKVKKGCESCWSAAKRTGVYKSDFERTIAESIEKRTGKVSYETSAFRYVVEKKYTPDFVLPNGICVETKGRWTAEDRRKMKLVKEQNPDADVRLLFTNANCKITKGSKTTYAQFCERRGWKYAEKTIPDDWYE